MYLKELYFLNPSKTPVHTYMYKKVYFPRNDLHPEFKFNNYLLRIVRIVASYCCDTNYILITCYRTCLAPLNGVRKQHSQLNN